MQAEMKERQGVPSSLTVMHMRAWQSRNNIPLTSLTDQSEDNKEAAKIDPSFLE